MTERRRLAVLGSPIAHSLSPAIHAAAYRVLGLDWEYGRAEVGEGGLAEFVSGLGPEWRGLSLTMPLKREATSVATEVDPLAVELGQANTLVLHAREIDAFTTDAHGIVRALRDGGVSTIRSGAILGGGATAESAAYALGELGARTITLAARSPDRVRSGPYGIVHLRDAPTDADVVISTVPSGSELPVRIPDRPAVLLDVVYNPWPTPLAAAWLSAGGSIISGRSMLLHQALAQVRAFVHGDPDSALPDESAVLRAMRAAVGGS